MRFRLKKHDKVLSFVFVAMLISAFLFWAFEEQFNKNDWKTNPSARYKMADDIVDSKLLIGKSKQEVIQLLGNPQPSMLEGRDHFLYTLGKAPSFFESTTEKLIVIFENETVTNVIHSTE